MKLKKLAIYVEGKTEQLFVKELINHIAGQGNIHFELKSANKFVKLKQKVGEIEEQHQILIYDCEGDERVKSTILDHRKNLIIAGYILILGLRDLYPNPIMKLEKIKSELSYRVPTAGVPTKILLAVSEVEAWFLQEDLHYSKIDKNLNVANFKESFNFDPIADSAETIAAPAELLRIIYKSVGKTYKKRKSYFERTIKAIDYENLYINGIDKLPHLSEFIEHVENFLAPDFS